VIIAGAVLKEILSEYSMFKNESCREVAAKCPSTLETICNTCKDHFNTVTSVWIKLIYPILLNIPL
jgi:hypothetical protein